MSSEEEKIKNMMENPLIDMPEDISMTPVQRLSYFEKIGLACAFLISMVIILISSFSLYIDLFIKSNYTYTVADLFILLICSGAIYFVINTIKRRVIADVLIDTAFQEGIYSRLRPLIENIARSQVDTSIILDRLDNMDMKVQTVLKQGYTRETRSHEFMDEPIAVGTSIKFAVKTILMVSVTMAAFMFFVNFQILSVINYAVLLIFVMWWVFITNEYNLWKDSVAWGMVFFPILVIPVLIMLMTNLLNYNILLAVVYFSVGLYTFTYYIWALYATTGSLPFIGIRKQENITSEFFASQNKGMIKEILDFSLSQLKKKLKQDISNQEPKLAWKK